MPALAAITGTACVFLFLAYAVRARVMRPAEARLRYLAPNVRMERTAGGDAVLRRTSSSIPALSRWLDASGHASRWAFDLERAGLSLRPGEYFSIRLLVGFVAAAVVALIGRNPVAVLVALPVFGFGFMLPAFWLSRRVSKRIDAINGQLVETIGLIANGLRAGFAFSQSVDVTSKRMGPPIATEFNRMLLDVNLGSSMEDALTAMNARVGSDDLDMVVTAILIQRNTGGNLAEVLEIVTETMRDRERIHGEIKTLTSSQRLTAWILSLWPAALGGVMYLINPSIMSLLWTTSAGIVLLGLWFTLNLLGVFTLQRILDIDV